MTTFGRAMFARIFLVCFLFLSANPASAQSTADPQNSVLEDAARAISAGNLNRAESELQSALHAMPEDARALDLLGVVRVLQQHESEAHDLFHKAIQKNPDFAPAHAHLGLLLLQLNRPEEAVPQLREALRIDPSRKDAADALVHILQEQSRQAVDAGDLPKALTSLAEASKISPENPDIQFAFGQVALRTGLFNDAVVAFRQTIKLRKNDPLAFYYLGSAFMELAKFEDARQQFAKYVTLRPYDASGYCALGMTLAALEHTPDARTQFERSIALAPQQTESYYRLGLLYLESKNLEAATKNLHQVLDHEPNHAGALTALGKAAFEQKDYSEAADLLCHAVQSDSAMREAHYYLGLALARLGRKQESEEQLQIALRLERDEASQRRVVRILDPSAFGPLSNK